MASASCLASPMGPREELILETFFSKLGQLAFDKAKEMMVSVYHDRFIKFVPHRYTHTQNVYIYM